MTGAVAGSVAGSVIVVGGGVRSGKSAFALARARALGSRRGFIATAQAFDAEMTARIAAHVRERGSEFQTIEEPHDLPERLAALRDLDAVVVDCLTLWLSNLMLRDEPSDRIAARVGDLARVLAVRRFHTIVVTNEVGMGVVPESALGRRFRDVAGLAHQQLARIADELYLAALGVVIRLRPAPVTVEPVVIDPTVIGPEAIGPVASPAPATAPIVSSPSPSTPSTGATE